MRWLMCRAWMSEWGRLRPTRYWSVWDWVIHWTIWRLRARHGKFSVWEWERTLNLILRKITDDSSRKVKLNPLATERDCHQVKVSCILTRRIHVYIKFVIPLQNLIWNDYMPMMLSMNILSIIYYFQIIDIRWLV